jgi:hypothetical protein
MTIQAQERCLLITQDIPNEANSLVLFKNYDRSAIQFLMSKYLHYSVDLLCGSFTVTHYIGYMVPCKQPFYIFNS